MTAGFSCSYSTSLACAGLAWKAWLFYGGYTLGNLFQYLLIQYTEGAVYAVVVQAMISPMVSIFWNLFQFDAKNNIFSWNPQFTTTTAFTVAGLALMVPGVFMYHYFSNKESKSNEDEDSPAIQNH